MTTTISQLRSMRQLYEIETEAFIRKTLLVQPKYRASLVLSQEEADDDDNYPVTVTLRDDGQDFSLQITDLQLGPQYNILMDGLNYDTGVRECNCEVDTSHYPDLLTFLEEVLSLK